MHINFISLGLAHSLLSSDRHSSPTFGDAPESQDPLRLRNPSAARAATSAPLYLGSEREDWIKEVTGRFNQGAPARPAAKRVVVEAVAEASGELAEDLLTRTRARLT
jgi:hypothetical protein